MVGFCYVADASALAVRSRPSATGRAAKENARITVSVYVDLATYLICQLHFIYICIYINLYYRYLFSSFDKLARKDAT